MNFKSKKSSCSSHQFWKALPPILLGLSLLTACGPGPTESRFIEEGGYVGEAIGKVLQENHPGIQVVVMTRPGLEYNPLASSEEAILEGLKKTFKASIQVAELQPDSSQLSQVKLQTGEGGALKWEDKDFRTYWYKSYSQWYSIENLKAFMESQKGKADLIICMPGFPSDLSLENFPGEDGVPALAALNMSSDQALKFLENGKGWMYQAVRPTENISEKPGLEVIEVGAHSIILYPSEGTP